MKVATYFEPLDGYRKSDHFDLLALWMESWLAQGCEVEVMGMATAKRHPKFNALYIRAMSFPTINPRQYEMSCFLRWCAAALTSEPIIMMDYDVFSTEHFDGWPVLTGLTTFDHIPSCIGGFGEDFEKLIDRMITYNFGDQEHVSDMTILLEMKKDQSIRKLPWLKCYGVPGWKERPLVHFANWYLPEITHQIGRYALVKPLLKDNLRVSVDDGYTLPTEKLLALGLK